MRVEQATFGAGCFWGVEAAYRKVPGVTSVTAGYMGGTLEDPGYEDVITDRTGHVEVVQLEFDPVQVSYEQLLELFWLVHDPTQVDRQGNDVGTQYRSVIFYHSDKQRQTAEAAKQSLESSGRFTQPIATAIEPAQAFYAAEEYHQRYLEKNPGGYCHVNMGVVSEFISGLPRL